MDVLTENPLAVLHLLCAMVAVLSGLSVRLLGWRGRPPGGTHGWRTARPRRRARPLLARHRPVPCELASVMFLVALESRLSVSSWQSQEGDDTCSPLLA